jgi:hypothetical protein
MNSIALFPRVVRNIEHVSVVRRLLDGGPNTWVGGRLWGDAPFSKFVSFEPDTGVLVYNLQGTPKPSRILCTYGKRGDLLAVRERLVIEDDVLLYEADRTPVKVPVKVPRREVKWLKDLNSLGYITEGFVPVWSARYFLRVLDLYFERFEDSTDYAAEGIVSKGITQYEGKEREEYVRWWNEAHAPLGFPAETNPFVWKLTVEVERGKD